MLNKLQFLIKYRFTILVASVVLFLSLVSSSDVPSTNLWNFYGADKIVHFSMYFALSFILFYEKYKKYESGIRITIADNTIHIIAIVALSGIIELIQPVLANRSCEFFDFVANTIGVLGGFYAHTRLRIFLKR